MMLIERKITLVLNMYIAFSIIYQFLMKVEIMNVFCVKILKQNEHQRLLGTIQAITLLCYVLVLCKGQEIPIYIWYESYPTHSGEGYEGRVSRVSPKSPYGDASLNLTNIRETDQGWYECKVVFLNRPPNTHKNGTWFHLDVHG